MIWHVHAEEFIRFVEADGFRRLGQTERHDVYERGADRILLHRSPSLTQAEVDGICDALGLDAPPMQSFFGD